MQIPVLDRPSPTVAVVSPRQAGRLATMDDTGLEPLRPPAIDAGRSGRRVKVGTAKPVGAQAIVTQC
jgi:hypothetical protein